MNHYIKSKKINVAFFYFYSTTWKQETKFYNKNGFTLTYSSYDFRKLS